MPRPTGWGANCTPVWIRRPHRHPPGTAWPRGCWPWPPSGRFWPPARPSSRRPAAPLQRPWPWRGGPAATRSAWPCPSTPPPPARNCCRGWGPSCSSPLPGRGRRGPGPGRDLGRQGGAGTTPTGWPVMTTPNTTAGSPAPPLRRPSPGRARAWWMRCSSGWQRRHHHRVGRMRQGLDQRCTDHRGGALRMPGPGRRPAGAPRHPRHRLRPDPRQLQPLCGGQDLRRPQRPRRPGPPKTVLLTDAIPASVSGGAALAAAARFLAEGWSQAALCLISGRAPLLS